MVANTPLKGRKKFLADLNDSCKKVYEVRGIQVIALNKGEDEGSIICEIGDSSGSYLASLNLLVPEPSEYPKHHQFYCFAQQEDPPEFIQDAASDVPDAGACTIDEILIKLLNSVSKYASGGKASEEDEEADEEDEGMYDDHFDDDYGLSLAFAQSSFDLACLQRDFNEIVATGYRPGSIRLGADGFCLSVSIPVTSLAHDISPQALMAWDSRLLSKTQHLTLFISGMRSTWPILNADGSLSPEFTSQGSSKLTFRVGLSRGYKPSKDLILELVRTFGLKEGPDEDDVLAPLPVLDDEDPDVSMDGIFDTPPDQDEEERPSTFHFSLSTSLESLMQDQFLAVVSLRARHSLGWAAAELLLGESQRLQQKPEDLMITMKKALHAADDEERQLAKSYNLPLDPIIDRQREDALNFPLLAFSYLIRRLTLCTRFCLVCYQKLKTDFVALKPYVCDSGLCAYQYYSLNRGPSLEYEICARPETVDILVSLTYVAASSNCLEGLFPTGLGLVVPFTDEYGVTTQREFDTLDAPQMSLIVVKMLKTLPAIKDMKAHLEKKTKAGRAKRKLKDMDPNVLPAAWLMLRWCVASCTAYLEELTSDEDRLGNIPSRWRQFRFSVGSPDAEAKQEKAKMEAASEDSNARKYPSLYAFHGSPTSNWHSIIRHGLWYKKVLNGRAYGDGVYFAKDGNISLGSYSYTSNIAWPPNRTEISKVAAIAEIVNLPNRFKAHTPYFVVPQTDWIVCRYLLVDSHGLDVAPNPYDSSENKPENVPTVQLDPTHPLTMGTYRVHIPEPSHRLRTLLEARQVEYTEEEYDTEDQKVFNGEDTNQYISYQPSPRERSPAPVVRRGPDGWTHDPDWVTTCLPHTLPPPADAMPMATMALQKELKNMLREQDRASSLAELGWYMPPEFIGDNLFQWIVELHSFEKELPIAKDLKARSVNSLVFEIRFPPAFPHSPPFFRILRPRFLPFIHGGGGHVTGGGSMCMDLLTTDGWLPSYSIPAILLQIRLAISNLDPRPARLASNWNVPYSMAEAVAGFQRAAATHGWKVPKGLEALI